MERLTYKEGNHYYFANDCLVGISTIDEDSLNALQNVLDKLGAYEDAEEHGLLLRLPYPLGTEYIYFVDEKYMDVYELDAEEIEVSMMPISNKVLYTVDCFEILFEDFGKIVFLTRAEAEAKLKEMEGRLKSVETGERG